MENGKLTTNDLEIGMTVLHSEWGRCSDPMTISIDTSGELMLNLGGESEHLHEDEKTKGFWIVCN